MLDQPQMPKSLFSADCILKGFVTSGIWKLECIIILLVEHQGTEIKGEGRTLAAVALKSAEMKVD